MPKSGGHHAVLCRRSGDVKIDDGQVGLHERPEEAMPKKKAGIGLASQCGRARWPSETERGAWSDRPAWQVLIGSSVVRA